MIRDVLSKIAKRVGVVQRRIAAAFDIGGDEEDIRELGGLIQWAQWIGFASGVAETVEETRAEREKLPPTVGPVFPVVVEEIETPEPAVPFVVGKRALEAFRARTPEVARGFEEVARVYNERQGFALAKSASLEITERVKDVIEQSIAGGFETRKAEREAIRQIAGFTDAYAENIVRTNLATAYQDGRASEARESLRLGLVIAWEFNAVGDSDTRPNHHAADGLIAAPDDPIWREFSPPLGYMCRCSTRIVNREEIERRGLLTEDGRVMRYEPPGFASASPDPGFGSRVVV